MKPKILIIFNRLVIGGQAVDNLPLAYHLKNDFEILIVHGEKEEDEVEASFLLQKYPSINLYKISLLKRSINPFVDVLAFIKLLKIINKFKPQIIHTHGAKIGIFGRLIGIIKNIRTVHTFHGHLFHSYFSKLNTFFLIKLESWLYKKTTAIIALSNTQKQEISSWLHIKDASKIHVINLGIDYIEQEGREEMRQTFRNKHLLNENDIAIGIVGRLVPIKNNAFFIDIVEHLIKNDAHKNLIFFLVGDGNKKQELIAKAMEKNLNYAEGVRTNTDQQLIFTSWINNIQEVIEGLDIVVNTSLNEGTPFSLIESQLCGKPVVAIHVGGTKDTFLDNESGFLINGHDILKFSEKILFLASHTPTRLSMGAKGKEWAENNFSKAKEVAAIKQLYTTILSI